VLEQAKTMNFELSGKVALVTGGSKGIGRGISAALAAEGCKLAVCARGQDAIDETVAEAQAAGVEALGVSADVTNKADIDGVVDAILDKWGRLDVLVNNAGGEASTQHSLDEPDETWAHVYNLNLWSCILFSRRATAKMKKQGGGNIVNVSSVGGHSGFSGMGDYNSAKAAMLSLTKTWAQIMGPIYGSTASIRHSSGPRCGRNWRSNLSPMSARTRKRSLPISRLSCR
jgi:3-oxoacyl-[acyl-carrier protein] reductase